MEFDQVTYKRDDESSGERLDRHWSELLQELRLAQTGTQILFAFLLGIAFQSQFHSADAFTHVMYAATLVAAALAAAFFLAPVALHRALYGLGLRDRLVTVTDRLARAGMTLLVASMSGGVLIALDVVLPRPLAGVTVGGVLIVFVSLWLVLPAYVKHKAPEKRN
ncbi:DUF6328 family protein [Kribbella sp. NPDC003557]|uniref:DUF6328 family protein n=1 Tax=Kribbella sp. NPDC003557 TaxID=3154449 RepID=UPI0033B7884D